MQNLAPGGREMYRELKKTLKQNGIKRSTITLQGNGHQRMTFVHSGVEKQITMPSTTSDVRCIKNVRSELRKLLR
jgi:hypothetical protein